MKLIFLKDVGGVGQHGQVKEISDGYALNYLIPRGLAVQATPEALAKHVAKTKQAEEARVKEHAELVRLVQSVEGSRVEMKVRATDKGGLFKSITAADVVKALGKAIPAEAVILEKPIKEVGEHILTIKIADVSAKITLAVSAA